MLAGNDTRSREPRRAFVGPVVKLGYTRATSRMTVLAMGSRLGPYEIREQIGAGGMGEVYRATDTRLKRQVAIKVLPAALTADTDRLARFQREAEVLASLNHPNIAGLYGLEESGGVKALVMELVEGPTLDDRIAQGAIPVEQALPIARQIAEALEAAHERGVIHRDLKPANIKLRPDGAVKVLDFGLAKAMAQGSGVGDQGSESLAHSPTITSPAMTMHGVILGTAAYMSPEQAAGKQVDRRTDLWAFGVVLFEMLSGRRLFDGESVSHVIAAVLKDEPDWSAVPADTPPMIRALLKRCLQRDRRKRLSDAGMARLEIDDALTEPATVAVLPVQRARPLWAYVVASLIAGALAGAAPLVWWLRAPAAVAPLMTTFAIDLAAEQVFTRAGRHVLALSPDGRQLVFVAEQQLFIRAIDDLNAKPLTGTSKADPSEPTFSPDGQWIAFWSGGQLKKISIAGGTPVPLADIQNPYGMSWSGDRIAYAHDSPPTIAAISANGGTPEVLISLDRSKKELAQNPQLVAGGRAVLFALRTGDVSWNDAEIVVQDVGTGRRQTLIRRGTDPRALANGYLLYSLEDALFAAPFNADRPEQVGTAVPVRQNIMQSVGGFTGAAQFATSASGTLAFVPDDLPDGDRILQWMDRQGKVEPIALPSRLYWPGGPALSVAPDGKHAAMRIVGSSRALSDVWVWDLAQGGLTRLTLTGGASDPVWSRDSASVCYASRYELLCQPFDGASPPRALFKKDGLSSVSDMAPDGTALFNVSSGGGFDIWVAPNVPQREPSPLIATRANELGATVSSDGRWLAYQSEESGADEVYVRPFPVIAGGKWQVSSGGIAPRWSKDGRALYYLATRTGGAATSLTLMAVQIGSGAGFQFGAPTTIAPFPNFQSSYDVMPNGRFLMTRRAADPVSGTRRPRVVVIQNWFNELSSKVAMSSTRQ